MDKVVYVSAFPGPYELQKSEGLIVEQIIRPTGLLDPVVEVRPAKLIRSMICSKKCRVRK